MTTLHSLGEGTAGEAVTAAVIARSTSDWAGFRDLIRTMTSGDVPAHHDQVGLYGGLPAVAFALRVSGRFENSRTLAALDAKVEETIEVRLTDAEERLAAGRPPRMREYDLIRGLTGFGAILLCSPHPGPLLDDVLSYLVRLTTEPITVAGRTLPGWWTTDGPTGEPETAFPHGHSNLGLAHGVSGPLALLALAMLHGHKVKGQADAVHATATTLADSAMPVTGNSDTLGWQAIAQPDEWGERSVVEAERPSWCYGTPGITRAIQLAAIATKDTTRQRWAESVMGDSLSNPAHLALITDSTVCHGWAGAYLIAAHAAVDAEPDSRLQPIATALADRINPTGATTASGLLTGPAGIRLAQHDHRTRTGHPQRATNDDTAASHSSA
ncbi:MAG: lanthionine synthetase C family protein, partial [Pseudonocardiaceae bacterium]